MAIFKTKKEKETERKKYVEKKVSEGMKPPSVGQRLLKHQQEKKEVGEGKRKATGDAISQAWKKLQEEKKKKK